MQLTYSRLKFRKADRPAKTYHAGRGSYMYTVAWDGSRWTLRIWNWGHLADYGYGNTALSMMQSANEHAEART